MYDDLGYGAALHSGSAVATLNPSLPHQRLGARPDPRQNHLLAALGEAAYAEIFPALEGMPLPLGLALRESGCRQHYVYFPTSGIVAILHALESGVLMESAVTGREGMIGTQVVLGSDTATSRAVVIGTGYAYRLGAAALKKLLERGGELQYRLLRYTQALITQQAQTAACNRHHTIERQLCRWLLLCLDRLSSDELVMTQELIASMLGVRREGVTEAAGRLQARQLISCRRGHIAVLDRARLEASACECYAVVKREYERLLPSRLATSLSVPASAPAAPPRRTPPQTLSVEELYA